MADPKKVKMHPVAKGFWRAWSVVVVMKIMGVEMAHDPSWWLMMTFPVVAYGGLLALVLLEVVIERNESES